jgi:hypothetical protein
MLLVLTVLITRMCGAIEPVVVECSRTGHVIGFDRVSHMVRGLGVMSNGKC